MPLPIITTLADTTVREMFQRLQTEATKARQRDAERRVSILGSDWLPELKAYIDTLYSPEAAAVKSALKVRAKRSINILRRLTNAVCVAYETAPKRELEGATQAQQDAFAQIVKESRAEVLAQQWERHAFALNRTIVVPVVRWDRVLGEARLQFDELLPHYTEVKLGEDDPMGEPIAAVYTTRDGSDRPSGFPCWTTYLDHRGWQRHDEYGKPIGPLVPHGAGVFPGQPFTVHEQDSDDWWSAARGEEVVEATLGAAHLHSRLNWVRDQQDRFREILFSQKVDKIPKQFAGGVITIPMNAQEASYQTLNAVVSPEDHIKHIRFEVAQAAESFGVPIELIDFEASQADAANISPLAAGQRHALLKKVRAAHIKHLVAAEKRLWVRAALVMRGMGHPLASLLPPDLIAERLSIEFGDLTFVDHPSTMLEVIEKKVDLGLESTVGGYLTLHPQLTREQAREQVQRLALEEGELNQFYIEHNIPRDASERRQTLAQLQGRVGGEASGEARREEAEDDDASSLGRGE